MVRRERFTEDEVVDALREAVEDAGGQKQWADENGVTPQYVCDVLKRRRKPGESICTALGFQRVELYEAI